MKKECFDYSSDYKFFLIKEILNAVINDYTIINDYDCNKEFSASDIYEMQILDNHLKLNMHAKSRDNKIYDILTISMELDFKMIFGLVFGINGSCEVMGQSGPIKYQIDYLKALGNVDKIDDGSTFFLLITKDNDYNNSIRRIYKYNHWQLTREKDAEKSMEGVVMPYQDQESISKIMISRLRDYLKQDEDCLEDANSDVPVKKLGMKNTNTN